MNRIPTESEINVYDSLDEQWAVKNFLGKSLQEAEQLFQENFLRYQEDLMWMGPVAFAYYVQAAISYLLSEHSDRDACAASCFCALIGHRLEWEPEVIRPVRQILHSAISQILPGFQRFECEIEIFGDLESQYKVLLEKLADA